VWFVATKWGLFRDSLQEAKVEAWLGDLLQSLLAFLKTLLGSLQSPLTAFDEPPEAFVRRLGGRRPGSKVPRLARGAGLLWNLLAF
jgi:hypothetical protein